MAELVKKRICAYATGDKIKLLSEITEEDKPDFVELTDKELMDMFKDLVVEKKEDEDPEPMEFPSSLNYGIYDEEWYAKKFPGFPEETYNLMVQCDKVDNKE